MASTVTSWPSWNALSCRRNGVLVTRGSAAGRSGCYAALIQARGDKGTSVVALLPVEDSDLNTLFEQMRDLVSVRMAAFTASRGWRPATSPSR